MTPWMRIRHWMASVNESPILVLGNQKSGTSAIGHLLADYGGLSKTIDIPVLWGYRGLEVMTGTRRFADVVRNNAYFFSTDVIKEPMMTFFPDQVAERFPEGHYIFIVRDPRANIRSLLDSRGLPGDRSTLRPEDTQHLSAGRTLLDDDAWQIPAENYVGLLARRWNRAVEGAITLNSRVSCFQLVKYEDFVDDKYASIQRIASALGIQERQDISERLDQHYQPRGPNRGVDWGDFFGAENLSRINNLCAKNMSRLGYP
jgi:hypothetical protein